MVHFVCLADEAGESDESVSTIRKKSNKTTRKPISKKMPDAERNTAISIEAQNDEELNKLPVRIGEKSIGNVTDNNAVNDKSDNAHVTTADNAATDNPQLSTENDARLLADSSEQMSQEQMSQEDAAQLDEFHSSLRRLEKRPSVFADDIWSDLVTNQETAEYDTSTSLPESEGTSWRNEAMQDDLWRGKGGSSWRVASKQILSQYTQAKPKKKHDRKLNLKNFNNY